MGQPIDANGTQVVLDWSRINWLKIEKAVLRLQHRIFMAKVKGNVKGMESLQRLLASSRAAKLLAIRKVGQENSGRPEASRAVRCTTRAIWPRRDCWKPNVQR